MSPLDPPRPTDYVFQQIARTGRALGVDYTRNRAEAARWYRDQAGGLSWDPISHRATSMDAHRIMASDPSHLVGSINPTSIGRMYMFFYDPKHKLTLPYYDRFPLVFPFGMYDDGFIGMNMHYLSRPARAKLMDALYTVQNNRRHDDTTKLKISYGLLSSAAKYRWFVPTIHRYLAGHVRSRFLEIRPEYWDFALMLPTERFEKKSRSSVWRESAKIYNRGK
jgi:hypothetical protein